MTHAQHGGDSHTATVTSRATRRLRRSEPPGLYDAELASLASVFCRFTTDAELARAGGDDDLALRLLAAAHDVRTLRCHPGRVTGDVAVTDTPLRAPARVHRGPQ
jgi:hypothetical protein